MNNLIEYLKELFAKPSILWSVTDAIIFTTLLLASVTIVSIIVLCVGAFIRWLRKKRKK